MDRKDHIAHVKRILTREFGQLHQAFERQILTKGHILRSEAAIRNALNTTKLTLKSSLG